MKKITLLLAFFVCLVGFSQTKNSIKNNDVKTSKIVTKTSKPDKKTKEVRKLHANFLKNSPFKETKTLSKKESLSRGLPPNKYFEENWELTMNPETGRPSTENVSILRKKLEQDRNQVQFRTPGDLANNPWIERGPTNVGGRTRAVIFDPNDPTNETVFAGGVSGGLWKNTNISSATSVWTRLTVPENLAVSCITVDPNNSQIFYVGTGESYVGGDVNGDGVWKSVDGGVTWANILGGITGPTFFQSASNMTVNTPAGIAGNYLMVEAPQAFGTFPAITVPVSGDIVLADAGGTTPSEGCTAFLNAAAFPGKIAIIRRGTCNFSVKVKLAQDAGAIAAIIMNNSSDLPFAMGGNDPLITIPSVMISQAEGNLLQAALLNGAVNVTLNPSNGGFTGNMVPGIQHINAIKIRNNSGVSEVYVAVGDTFYGSAGTTTYLGGTTYGLYKTVNGGTTWNEVILPLTTSGKKHCPNDIEVGSNNKIWVSTINSRIYGEGGGVVFSSTDGLSFTQKHVVSGADRTQIVISATNPDKLYICAEMPANTAAGTPDTVAFVKTTDGFTTTTNKSLPVDVESGIPATDFTRGQASYDLMFEIDPVNDEKLFTGGIDIFNSTDGGTSWVQKSVWTPVVALPDVHSDQHAASFAPGAPNKMVFGNDGGVFYTNDSGTTINARNNGFNVTQFYSLGVAPTTVSIGTGVGDNFVAGAQDNGSNMFLNAPAGQSASVEVQGGDGAYSMFDQDGVDKYRITNYVYNNTIRLYNYATNSTRSINTEVGAAGDNGAFISPMTLDSKLDVLYADYTKTTTNRVRRYKNLKSGVVQKAFLTNILLNSATTALTVSKFVNPLSTSTLLIGTRSGRLLKLTNADAGTTALSATAVWSNLTGPGFAGSISDVEYGATENEILVTFHNYNVVSIWFTADGGVTWQNKEGNFPDIPVKAILRNPLNNDEVIIGTELGVWYTNTFNDASPTWSQSDNGMQNVRVTDLDLRNDNVVFAATYGRGVFSGAFTAPTLATNSIDKDSTLAISPNPSNGVFNLKLKKPTTKLSILIVDVNSKVVFDETYQNSVSEKSIDLSQFQAGIYIMKVKGDSFEYSEKLIKK